VRAAPLLLALLAASLLAPLAAAQADDAAVTVEAEMYVLNFGNYDVTKGTYTLDFYLTLRWNATAAPANFSALRYEFMDGRATASDKISDATDPETGIREATFRVQAALYNEPHFEHYPYDTQRLDVILEDAQHPRAELRYVPVPGNSGLDETVRIPGWRLENVTLNETAKAYPGDSDYSRLRFSVTISREPLSSTLKSFLPPVAFALVAGLAFFFHPSKVANRLTLGTGMLIAAVGFHISQTVNLPPIGTLILFDKVMLATYAFHVGGLVTSTLIHIDEDYWKDRDYTKQINAWGAVGSVAAFLVVLALLSFLL
jgi:hypothetical protein